MESFGLLGRTDSIGGDQHQILQRNSSGGNFSAQILATGSAPGIGYSPVNSFGTTLGGGFNKSSPSSTCNIMVVGGSPRDTDPPLDVYREKSSSSRRQNHHRSDDMEMYRSYSGGGGGGAGPLDDSHYHMSVGSFGYSRSYGEPSSPRYYGARPHDHTEQNFHHSRSSEYHSGISRHHHHPYSHSKRSGSSSSNRGPSFYSLLRKFKGAFKDCTFLLPGLQAAVLKQALIDQEDDHKVVESKYNSNWDNHVRTISW
jgi:hypothetical protein